MIVLTSMIRVDRAAVSVGVGDIPIEEYRPDINVDDWVAAVDDNNEWAIVVINDENPTSKNVTRLDTKQGVDEALSRVKLPPRATHNAGLNSLKNHIQPGLDLDKLKVKPSRIRGA